MISTRNMSRFESLAANQGEKCGLSRQSAY